MSLPNLFLNGLETLPIKRPTTIDVYGHESFCYPDEPTHYIEGCSVQPSSVVGIASGAFFSDVRIANATYNYTAYMPPDADIKEGDHIIWDGTEWEIDGGPMKWPDHVGLAHITCNMVRWTG